MFDKSLILNNKNTSSLEGKGIINYKLIGDCLFDLG